MGFSMFEIKSFNFKISINFIGKYSSKKIHLNIITKQKNPTITLIY